MNNNPNLDPPQENSPQTLDPYNADAQSETSTELSILLPGPPTQLIRLHNAHKDFILLLVHLYQLYPQMFFTIISVEVLLFYLKQLQLIPHPVFQEIFTN